MRVSRQRPDKDALSNHFWASKWKVLVDDMTAAKGSHPNDGKLDYIIFSWSHFSLLYQPSSMILFASFGRTNQWWQTILTSWPLIVRAICTCYPPLVWTVYCPAASLLWLFHALQCLLSSRVCRVWWCHTVESSPKHHPQFSQTSHLRWLIRKLLECFCFFSVCGLDTEVSAL